MSQKQQLIDQVIEAWHSLQKQSPLVQCITNSVASNYAANILLAAGASPAMIDNPFEAGDFTKISSALSINVGTPTTEQTQAMLISAQTAQQHEVPWILDPVGYGAILKWRSETVDQLLKFNPTIIRGNASEISALAGSQIQSKGVDSTLNSQDVYVQAKNLLNHAKCIAISGESDYIISKELDLVIRVNGGCHLQPKITATGCALGALTAAYSAVSASTIAALASHIHFAIAGKLAYEHAQTVGSFNVAFLDYVHMLDDNLIRQYVDVELVSCDYES
ncbi:MULTISPECIES: hydroxyethylthiazole kinase [Acinetobacter]|uniref:hydroxyethylthiazole kinase n=1 Tax=Acinetobacter TaxID=469 RepID=UPI000235E1C8|nr:MULTISPECIES: hydroxyethylthiazole kinase [Acinetobacter]KXZ74905.1 Hydroxyethylthiazole kinase [Acinetobacter venetianus]GAB01056.1 hydroxyethylthiazole kinase [Acinetobacter sp. NBRC 100985]